MTRRTWTPYRIHKQMHNLDSDMRYDPAKGEFIDYSEIKASKKCTPQQKEAFEEFINAYRRLHDLFHV